MNVLKKVVNIVIDILIILVVIVSIIIAAISLTKEKTGVSEIFGYVPYTVQSGSMSPVFEAGDLIVGKSVDDPKTYPFKKGDVITFVTIIEDEQGVGHEALNTHRIVKVTEDNGTRSIITKGDYNKENDKLPIADTDVVSVWASGGKDDGTRLKGLGKAFDYIKSPDGFLICVVIPMAAFFMYELFRFISNLVNYNKAKSKEAALEAARELLKDSASDSSGLSEEQAAKAVLQQMGKKKKGNDGQNESDESNE